MSYLKEKIFNADLYLALMVKVHSVDRLRAKRQYICRQSLRAQTNGSLAYWFVQNKNAFLCSFINNLCHLTFHIVIVSCTEFSFRAHTNIIRDMSKGMLDGNWQESKAKRVLPEYHFEHSLLKRQLSKIKIHLLQPFPMSALSRQHIE